MKYPTAPIVCVILLALSATAQAQERVPHAGSQAVGFGVGVFVPSSDTGDQLDNALPIMGYYEYYASPRISVRATTGWTRPSLTGSTIDQVRMMPLRFDVNYNWEGGRWHPFVGAGLGAYFLQYRRRGEQLGDAATNIGANIGGGIEYFLNRSVSVSGEGRYHAISNFGRVDPSGTTLTVGFKTYF